MRRKRLSTTVFTKAIAKAAVDPTSLGNILVEAGQVDDSDIDRALQYQRENRDAMMGEALIRLGKLDRDTLETHLLKQAAVKGSDKKAAGKLVKKLSDQVKKHTEEVRDLRAHVLELIK